MRAKDVFNYVYNQSTEKWVPQSYSTPAAGGGGTESLTKTVLGDLKEITYVSANLHSHSSEINVTLYQSITILIDHAPLSTSAPVAGTEYRIEVSEADTGDLTWRPVGVFRSGTIAAVLARTSMSEFPGDEAIDLNPTPAYTLTDYIFFKNEADFANSEWGKVADVESNVAIHLVDGLTNTQASSAMYNKAERFMAVLDLTSMRRIRVICDNNIADTSYDVAWRCGAVVGEYV